MSNEPLARSVAGPDGPHFTLETDAAEAAAWTEIEAGRFLPRRVRGSCVGRALG